MVEVMAPASSTLLLVGIASNANETNEQIEDYLADMAELARANGIKVILTSILPVFDYPWTPGLKPAPRILAINAWMKKYAAEHYDIYVDYHSAMKDERNGLPASLAANEAASPSAPRSVDPGPG